MKVGFIGLGSMGAPMALNILKGGHELLVWARREETTRPLVDVGARRCASPKEVGALADVVVLVVTTGHDVEHVVLGEGGIAEGAKPGTVIIDCGTIPPDTSRRICKELRARGMEMLDSPVSGGETGARAGTLSIMVGGDAAAFERMQPVYRCMGKTIIHMGESGSGQVAKACNQLTLVVMIQGIAEAMLFARANGVDFKPIWEALMKGFAGSRMLDVFGTRMMNREFVAGLPAALHHKDIHIVLENAQATKTALPAAAIAAQAFNALMAQDGERWDSAAILKVMEEMSGFPTRSTEINQ
jgi:2-hydroxy-3-oxopropionate reductase